MGLGITQPLTNYRMSYQYSTTNINYTKTTLSHKEIISGGSIKSIKNRNENNNQKNLQQTEKFTENLQQNEKSTHSVHTLGDRIPETKKKEELYKNYKSWKRIAKNKKSKKTKKK